MIIFGSFSSISFRHKRFVAPAEKKSFSLILIPNLEFHI